MGRRRRVSNSTASSTDTHKILWVKETKILTPAIPGADKPTVVLDDAVIYAKDVKTLANPLFLNNGSIGPVVVRGKLEPVEKADPIYPQLVKPSVRTANIEISKCVEFAIGYHGLVLWVAGESAWYEVRPSPIYEAMFLEAAEAIALYYEAVDKQEEYEKKCGDFRKRKKSSREKPPQAPTLEDFFLSYAIGVGDGVTRDEAEARYRKWAPFLATHLSKKEDGVTWEGTPFAQWIKGVAAESKVDIERLALQARPVLQEPSRSRRSTLARDISESRSRSQLSVRSRRRDSSHDVEMVDIAPPKTRPVPNVLPILRKGKEKVETPVPLPPEYHLARQASASNLAFTTSPHIAPANKMAPTPNITSTSSPQVDAILETIREHAEGKNLMKMKPSSIFTKIYMKCKIGAYKAAPEVIHYYAKELRPRLGPEWKGTPFDSHLKEVSQIPLIPEHTTLDKIPAMAARRAAKASSKANPRAPEATPPVDTRRHRRLSQEDIFDDDSEGEDAQPAKRGRMSGKAAGLRLIGSKKRPASAMSPDYDSDTGSRRGRKSAKASHPATDDDDGRISDSTEDASSSSEDEGDQVNFPVPPPPGSVRIVIHAERIPTMSPSGPNGTWTCEEEGCSYVVRAADEEDGQDLIRAHFRGHEAQVERINLAMKESQNHGRMPIKYVYFPPVLLIIYFHRPNEEKEPIAPSPPPPDVQSD
ncbi:hypothetical protein OQA88_4709 [Cercophora sp. LCS_1]